MWPWVTFFFKDITGDENYDCDNDDNVDDFDDDDDDDDDYDDNYDNTEMELQNARWPG